MRTAPPANPNRVRLREDFAPRGERVDRERCIIFGVKVLGRTSPNNHQGTGSTHGTVYTDQALQQAAKLYEKCNVNCDHLARNSRGQDRSALHRCGWLENCRVEAGGVYADLHLLPSHQITQPLLEAAERNPRLFAMSHDAWGKGQVRGGKYVVSEIPEVRSVDVVADGATVASLFESKQPRKRAMKTKTVRHVLESLLGRDKSRLSLLEGCDYGEEKKLMEQPVDDMGMVEEPPAPMEAAPSTLEDSLSSAVVAVLNDPGMDKAMKRKKILGILNLLDEPAAEETAPVEEEMDEEAEPEEDREMEESNRGKRPADPEVRRLREELDALKREKTCRELCESERVSLQPAQFKALQLLESDKDRKTFLAECRTQASKPRTQPIRESLQTTRGTGVSNEEWFERLTGRSAKGRN